MHHMSEVGRLVCFGLHAFLEAGFQLDHNQPCRVLKKFCSPYMMISIYIQNYFICVLNQGEINSACFGIALYCYIMKDRPYDHKRLDPAFSSL